MDDQKLAGCTTDQRTFPAAGVQSLVWSDGKLRDWVGGNVEYGLDGTKCGPRVVYPYRFDAAIASPSGRFVALYERLGTKAILLGPEGLFRELNRSYYHAHVYEYPILLFRLADGREVLAHCPEDYCRLQLEDPTTAQQLSEAASGELQSMFHSRLAANAAGSRIMSAGWVWHPFDAVCVFDLKPTSDERIALEPCENCCPQGIEVGSAAFNHSGLLVVASAKGAEDFGGDEPGERLRPGMIGVYDVDQQSLVSLAPLEDEAGTLMPVGTKFVVGFFDHPKLIEVETGRVVRRWPELKTGRQTSSILWHKPLPPPVALDPTSGRFAVAGENEITVVTLSTHLLDQ